MEIQKFRKNILISGYKPLDFKTDDGVVKMCKVFYQYDGDNVNTFGIQQKELNFPYEYRDKFDALSFPVNGVVIFSCENLTTRPVLEDLEIVPKQK